MYSVDRLSKMNDTHREHVLHNDNEICLLDCISAFKNLTEKEKKYAHHMSIASWAGSLIVLTQTSPEAPGIFLLLQKLFRNHSVEKLQSDALDVGLSEDHFEAFLMYAAGFYNNMGNYKSFGDKKFIPNLPQDLLEKMILHSVNNTTDGTSIRSLWNKVSDTMYSLSPRVKQLGFSDQGATTYYSINCTEKDAAVVQEYLLSKDLLAYNTRVFKTLDPDTDHVTYQLRLASVQTEGGPLPGSDDNIFKSETFCPSSSSQEVTIRVTRGDYSKLMALMVDSLEKAKEFAANEMEVKMLDEYITSFRTGSIKSHKEGSRHWIRNKSPIIETYIGFIESYRDPYGVRGEFEGFVAVVNKQMTAKFSKLVENAPHLLTLLPWPADYEKDTFLQPDFTSLDVLTFGGSGIPAGINIPNYDDIRQNEGFKNVSLGNVIVAGYKDSNITFLESEDRDLYKALKIPAFEVQVGLHELLGHGSGKLFKKDDDGTFNFDIENVKHTETGEKIESYYIGNETWDSKFSTLASTYEECRAECVGLYLCLSFEVLKIFGYEDDRADDIIYVNWLNMVRAGLLGLEFYSPERRKWGQAHMQARFVILRVLLEAKQGLVNIKRVTGSDDQPDLVITLERSKIIPVGKPAIGKFLQKLQVYKSTGDSITGKALYEHYSDVNDNEEPHFLLLRDIVMQRKQARKLFVQHNTILKDDTVSLRTYEAKPSGVIQSFLDRYKSQEFDDILQVMWSSDKKHFPSF